MAGEEQANHVDFLDISRDIVEGCGNVPLALRVVGSLLHGQDKTKWESFRQWRLTEITDGRNTILPILMFSYRHLSPTLKACFSYCAVFPKDLIFKKQTLIKLWMAQGFVKPLVQGQSIEDTAEECFLILLHRCFLEDVQRDDFGDIDYCKMHDLMHDLAQGVVGKQIFIASSRTSNLDENIQHLHDNASLERAEGFITGTKIRTYLRGKTTFRLVDTEYHFPVCMLVAKWFNLRTLDLSYLGLRSLPVAIGNLLHLRYLDLCGNANLGMLPESITKLVNLQTLNLMSRRNLKELPNDINKLFKLRFLDVRYCGLSYMPPGMKKLTCLRWLPLFVVRNSSLKQLVSELEDLRTLKLKGHLTIEITKNYEYVRRSDRAGGYLSNMEHLVDIYINFQRMIMEREEDILEYLRPHRSVKKFYVHGPWVQWGENSYDSGTRRRSIRRLAATLQSEKVLRLNKTGRRGAESNVSKIAVLLQLGLLLILAEIYTS